MSQLVLSRLAKRFGAQAVLTDVSLAIAPGEILALVGPSGSGKTTLLRLLAGFESADAGEIRFGDERLDRTPPEQRRFGMVFQHYALFPHLTVGGNVAFGLEGRGRAREEIAARVAAALARVDLAGFEKRKVGELSGGQQQRVALARALAPEPRVLLLDEPLSNLDPTLRERTRHELAVRLREIGITTVLVTHEQEEAFELGQRVAVLHEGRLAQVGTPQELYRAPATRFVASFVGRGTFLRGRARAAAPGQKATVVSLPGQGFALAAAPAGEQEQEGDLFVRPEALALVAPGEPGAVRGEIVAVRFAGPVSWVTVRLADGAEVEVLAGSEPLAAGERVGVLARPGAGAIFFAAEGA